MVFVSSKPLISPPQRTAAGAHRYRDEPIEPGMEEVDEYYDNPMQQDKYYHSQQSQPEAPDALWNSGGNKKSRRMRTQCILAGTLLLVIGILASMIGKRNSSNNGTTVNNKKQPYMTRNPDLEVSVDDGDEDEDDQEPEDIVVATPSAAPKLTPAPTPFDLYEYITELVGEDALQDESSPAAKAYQWMDDNPSAQDDKRALRQRFSLATLYYATNSEKWLNKNGWLSSSSECEWHGVDCGNVHEIIKLNLTENGLEGEIPSELSLLGETLLILDVSGNPITNAFDKLSFLSPLHKLKLLNMEDTFVVSQGIPTSIATMSNLEVLIMADTLMTGPLEGAVFEKMSHLHYLEISENAFNSTIPELLAKLPKLSAFYAYDCGIQGELQDFLPHMKSMFELWMDDNDDLGGTIPTLIGGLTDLASLSLANNDIVGTISSEIGKLTKMDQMWLYGNWITGTIPSQIGLLTALKIFEVEDNSIKETSMPSEVCQLDMVALSSDCGGEDDFVDCDCCTCCEAPCPIKNLPIYGNRRRR